MWKVGTETTRRVPKGGFGVPVGVAWCQKGARRVSKEGLGVPVGMTWEAKGRHWGPRGRPGDKILQKVICEKRLEESKGDPGAAFEGLNGSKK